MREHPRQVNAVVAKQAAFADNPNCYTCGKRVPSLAVAAYYEPPDEGPRVTHLSTCLAAAIQRHNPTFNRRVAVARAEA